MKVICLSIVLLLGLALPSLAQWSATSYVAPGRKTTAFKEFTCRNKSGSALKTITRSAGTDAAMISADGRFLGIFSDALFVLYGEACEPLWERHNLDNRGGAISDHGERILLPFSLAAEGFEDMPRVRNRWIEVLDSKGSLVWKVDKSSGYGSGYGLSKNGRFAYIQNFSVRHVDEPYSKEYMFESLNIGRKITHSVTGLIADTTLASIEIEDDGHIKVWANGKRIYESRD
jgi:hypothetical protein